MSAGALGEARVFALTGGIGSGKSAVASVWRALGVAVVDADELAREAVAPGTEALGAIAAQFGPEMLQEDGSLDRKALGKRVFSDATAREELNAIVHPQVRRLAEAKFASLAAEGHDLICYEIPLLFETKQEDRFRPVVVVSATPLQQMERVSARDSLSPTQAAARLGAQIPLREKAEKADIVIVNGSTLEDLEVRAKKALSEVRAWSSEA